MGKLHDVVKKHDFFEANRKPFFVHPESWKAFKPGTPLNWSKVKFEVASRPLIPTVRGVYIFSLEAEIPEFPPHGYILYVGETGDKSSATLRERFNRYLLDQKKQEGRARVTDMLIRWSGDLTFYFVAVPDTTISVKSIQDAFIAAAIPPVNKTDFTGDVALMKKVAW